MSELFKAGQILGRSEMKKIMAGSDGGNVYCMSGGEQFHCFPADLEQCLDACVAQEDAFGDECGGCAQFPEVN
ncbi:MAG TPA: hypothetical protein VJ946_04195 [Bacteroidales bacterium]|nr:hypothetical protein [Bacteroidales bacterium]